VRLGLKAFDSTLIVPALFASYTATSFVNSLVYLHELPSYRTWVLVMIWLCIAVLIAGVVMLSAKRAEPTPRRELGNFSSEADPEGEAQQTAFALKDLGRSAEEGGRRGAWRKHDDQDGAERGERKRPKSGLLGGRAEGRPSEDGNEEDEVDGLPDDGEGSLPGYSAVATGDDEFGGFVGEQKR
jgi:hypothetical protein